jgi:N-acetyl-gamma-glutamyl-phosphate reductase
VSGQGEVPRTRVAVVGATGYAGAELVRLLHAHPAVEIVCATSEKDAGKPLGDVHRYLTPTGLQLTAVDVGSILERGAVFAFVALPHGASTPVVRGLVDGGIRVVDVGADFRFADPAAYERAYGPHAEPALLAEAVYGLTEHARRSVAGARLVANPGCYPTGALMGLLPLADLVEGTVFVDSKSGTSGAGRSAATNQLFAEVTESLRPYSVWKHRHQPEIQEKLSLAGGRARVLFAPQLLPIARGLLSSCYFSTSAGDEIGRRLESVYRNEPFVRVLARGTWPEPRNVRGTNLVEIGWQIDDEGRNAVVMTAIDNLGKGAAGQAVQNFNCMLGLAETTGLVAIPALP